MLDSEFEKFQMRNILKAQTKASPFHDLQLLFHLAGVIFQHIHICTL